MGTGSWAFRAFCVFMALGGLGLGLAIAGLRHQMLGASVMTMFGLAAGVCIGSWLEVHQRR